MKAAFRLWIFLSLFGKRFQILGPVKEMLSVPWYTVFTDDLLNWETYLGLWGCSFLGSNNSVMSGGRNLLLTLKISVARFWRILLWIEKSKIWSASLILHNKTKPFFTRNSEIYCKWIWTESNSFFYFVFLHSI